jgi:hypothetical protein
MTIIKNYTIELLQEKHNGGFSAFIENNKGQTLEIEYSSITEKFYGAKIPKYLQTALIEIAEKKGFEISFDKAIGL